LGNNRWCDSSSFFVCQVYWWLDFPRGYSQKEKNIGTPRRQEVSSMCINVGKHEKLIIRKDYFML
jgi:hypothetical protein